MTEVTGSEFAYRAIQRDVINGVLGPNLKLKVAMLVERYSIGATPVREALSRLASDGLVLLEGQRGFRVRSLSAEEARDIENTRALLEIEAVRQAIISGDEEWEASIVGAFHKLRKVELMEGDPADIYPIWEERNNAFHSALVSACPSEWVLRFRERIYDQHRRYRHLSKLTSFQSAEVAEEHRLLMDAALARDTELAARVLRQHIARSTASAEAIIEGMARSQTQI